MSWNRHPGARLVTMAVGLAVIASGPHMGDAAPEPDAPDLRLVVNVPARRLDVFVDGDWTRSYPVAVGRASYPTPTGTYRIGRAVWNPWWHPPDSEWAVDEVVTPPGPLNPMGRVKLYFRPTFFVHGSPHESSLGHAASHGCIRMSNEDAIELARLVHRHGAASVSPRSIDWLIRHPGETRTIRLADPIALDVVYRRVEVHGGRLMLHPDVYGRGDGALKERAVQALMAAGYAASSIDGHAIEEMVARARYETASVPIDGVLVSERAAKVDG